MLFLGLRAEVAMRLRALLEDHGASNVAVFRVVRLSQRSRK